jgi:hypothetical protein
MSKPPLGWAPRPSAPPDYMSDSECEGSGGPAPVPSVYLPPYLASNRVRPLPAIG